MRVLKYFFIVLFSVLLPFSCYSDVNNDQRKKVIFIPGVEGSRKLKVLTKEWRGKPYIEYIDEFLKASPKGINIYNQNIQLVVDWTPPIALSGKTFGLGEFQLEVATVEPIQIQSRVNGNTITLYDESCFSYDGNESATIEIKFIGDNNDYELINNMRFYKIVSAIDDQERAIREEVKRLSCFFVTNLGTLGSYRDKSELGYSIRLVDREPSSKYISLFGSAEMDIPLDHFGEYVRPVEGNWLWLGQNEVILRGPKK